MNTIVETLKQFFFLLFIHFFPLKFYVNAIASFFFNLFRYLENDHTLLLRREKLDQSGKCRKQFGNIYDM